MVVLCPMYWRVVRLLSSFPPRVTCRELLNMVHRTGTIVHTVQRKICLDNVQRRVQLSRAQLQCWTMVRDMKLIFDAGMSRQDFQLDGRTGRAIQF